MAAHEIAAAMQRIEAALQRRPELGLHDDAPASARWDGGLRIAARHANGTEVLTDMPAEFGGSGTQVTPGWLFRAGIASCAATRIAMGAASAGIELQVLEVHAGSRSDTRGLFGLFAADGAPVSAAPQDMQLHVRIAARGIDTQRLRALVEQCCRLSPIPCAAQQALPLVLHIETESR